MKQRKHRRAMVRRWDSVHSSWDAVCERDIMWPSRKVKPCGIYNAWCSDCNTVEFKRTFGRFPHSVLEFNQFEDFQQATQGG